MRKKASISPVTTPVARSQTDPPAGDPQQYSFGLGKPELHADEPGSAPVFEDAGTTTEMTAEDTRAAVVWLPLSDLHIHPEHRPRYIIDDDRVLAMSESIAAVGVLHPIHVRPTQCAQTGAAYTLIAGLYRLLAARRAGWTEIPCTIHEVDEATAEAIAFEENETRSPLSVLDTARYVDQIRLNHIRRGERSTNEALGTFFRRSAAWISQRLTIHKGIPDALLARAAIPAAELVQLSKDALLTAAQITGDDQRHREEKQVAFLQAAAGDLRASAGVENILGKRSAARRPPLEIHQHRDGSVTIRCDPDRVTEINNREKRELITQLRHLATPLGLTVTATRRRSGARSTRRTTRPSSDSSTAGPA